MRWRCSAISVLVIAFLALAGMGRATVFDVSVKNRNFCCTNPPVFAYGAPSNMGGYHSIVATASQTGSGTPPIKFAMGHAAHFYSMFYFQLGLLSNGIDDAALPFSNDALRGGIDPDTIFPPNFGTFSVSNGAGTLQKSGGNLASFSFCPKAKGPGPGACTDPSKATPAPFFNGRIKVTPGPNKFGGTLQILAGPGGVGGSKFYVYRFLGGAGMSQLPAARVNGWIIDAPIGASVAGYHVFGPGPQYIGYPSTDFMMTSLPDAGLSIHGAGRFTTGMVTIEISMFNNPPVRSVMLTGADNRTPAGLGNIQVVSGLLFNAAQPGAPGPGANVLGWRMDINVIPEPGASLGLAAGALGLLGVGLLRARRARQGA